MADHAAPAVTSEDREDLRRRLYRPGAHPDDVAAYLGTGPDQVEAEAREAEEARPAGRRRVAPLVAGLAGAAALLLLLGGVRAAGGDGATPRPTEAAAAEEVRVVAAPLPTASVDGPSRFVFVRNLLGDHDAGLGAWLDARTGDAGVPRDRLVETHGSGDAVVPLGTVGAGAPGRLTVLLVLAQDGEAGWSTARLVIHDDRTIHLEPTSEHAGALRAGVPALARLDFTARTRPVRLLVQAPDDVEWGVAALFSS